MQSQLLVLQTFALIPSCLVPPAQKKINPSHAHVLHLSSPVVVRVTPWCRAGSGWGEARFPWQHPCGAVFWNGDQTAGDWSPTF